MAFGSHTKAAFLKIWKDFKQIGFICNVATQALTITYLIYNLCVGSGLWFINALLLAFATAYSIFFFYMLPHEEKKEVKKTVQRIYKWAKRLIKLFTIGVTVYGLFLAVDRLTPFSLILPVFTIVGWTLDILIEIICLVIESRLEYIFEGLAQDFGSIPIIGKHIEGFTGKEGAKTAVPSEKLLFLRNEVALAQAQEDERKAEAKEQKKADRKRRVKAFFSKKTKEKPAPQTEETPVSQDRARKKKTKK